MVFDGADIRLYINGVLDATSANIGADTIQPSTKDLTIGMLSYLAPTYYGYQGLIDELRIYNRALSALEVTTLFTAVGGDPALSFYESFDNLASISANGGVQNNLVLAAGKAGNAAEFVTGATLNFPAGANINANKGTIGFWFKQNWPGNDTKSHYYLNWRGTDANFRIFKFYNANSGKNYFVFRFDTIDGSQREVSSSAEEPGLTMQWQAGEWHHIEVFWDFTATQQYMGYILDGNRSRIHQNTWVLGTLPSTFSLGSTNTGSISADGAMDELKIYKESIFDPLNPIASYTALTRNDGLWQVHETTQNSPQDAPVLDATISPGEDFLFYRSDAFESIYEGSVPTAAAVTNSFNYRSAQNEYESLFFNLYSRQTLNGVQLDFTDFVGPTATIPKASAQLRVVKNWFQAGSDSVKTVFPVYTPELLVSDDRIPLQGLAWSYNSLPSLPILPGVVTDVASSTSKQFIVTLQVPDGTPPGIYTSTVTVTPATLPAKTLTLNVEVLPFTLPTPNKDYVIYHRARVDTTAVQDYTGLVRYQQQVEDIARHGFNGLTLYGADNGWQDDKLLMANNAGITRTAISMAAFNSNLKLLMESFAYEPYFYGRDEPNTMDRMVTEHLPKSIAIHAGGAKVVTAIQKVWADRLKDPNDVIYDTFPAGTLEPLDFTNVSRSAGGLQYFHDLIDGLVTSQERETYYWQIMVEDPRVNRFMSGYFLWNTGLNGIFPYVYQHVSNNPYDDFDIWSSHTTVFRDHLVTYPSQEGPVGTIQWEALREGIDDVRYLTAWQQLKDQALPINPTVAQASEVVISGLLAKYNRYENRLTVAINDFYNDRATIIDEILGLQNFLDDPDGDGLVNAIDTDDDNDGILDIYETNTGTFVSPTDTGTNALIADTDGDGVNDGLEVEAGTNPNDILDFPILSNGDVNNDGTVDAADLVLATRIILGQMIATPLQTAKLDVAPLVAGTPVPDGLITTGDYVVLVRKVVGEISF